MLWRETKAVVRIIAAVFNRIVNKGSLEGKLEQILWSWILEGEFPSSVET